MKKWTVHPLWLKLLAFLAVYTYALADLKRNIPLFNQYTPVPINLWEFMIMYGSFSPSLVTIRPLLLPLSLLLQF